MSTRLAVTIIGTAIGAYFGQPQLGAVAGAALGAAVDPTTVQGPRINEARQQTAAEGVPRAVIFGTFPCSGNIIQRGPLRIVQTSTSQGKGSTKVKGEKGLRTFAIGICEGVGHVLAVKQDGKLVYDVRPGSAMLAESAKWLSNKVFYTGSETQLPDPNLELLDADTPAYRGTTYMVCVDEDVTLMGGAISQYEFVVARQSTLTSIFAPLVVNPWIGSRPIHSSGETLYRGGLSPNTWTDYATAVDANALEYQVFYTSTSDPVRVTAKDSKTFLGYKSSTNSAINQLPGGADFADDPEEITYRLAYESPPGGYTSSIIGGCTQFLSEFSPGIPKYTEGVNSFNPSVVITDTDPLASLPGYYLGVSCLPMHGFINYVAELRATRVPSPAEDLISPTVITGPAKQLCAIEYRSGVLYQNALGPVVLFGDPNYDNEAFWAAAAAAAISDGSMHADVATPFAVSQYVSAYQSSIGEPVQLSTIVDWLHRRCGINTSKYDTSELTDLLHGFGMGSAGYTAADAIDSLRLGYNFDKSAREKVYYPKRGKAAVKTITIADLTTVPDSTRRAQTAEIPYKLNVRYRDPIAGYAVLAQTAGSDSPDRRTTGEVTLDLPIALSADEAAQISDKSYKVTLAEVEGKVELTLMLDIATDLAEADCVGYVTADGRTMRIRIEQEDFADWSVKITGTADRQSAYTSDVTGLPTPEPTLPPSTIVGPTEMAIIDGSARTDSEDSIGYLAAATGALPPWHGAELQRSLDGGANYQDVYEFDTAARMAVLLEGIPAASPNYTDATNVVKIQFYRSTAVIDSLTQTQFLSEQGVFALENADGSWEYMQGRDVDVQVDESVHLSMLHRGLLNSGGSAHAAGARFVWLADATYIPASSSWIGAALTHRAVSFDETEDETVNEVTHTYVGRSQTEWPVASLVVTRAGSNISATWAPRHRFGTDDAPVASTNFRGYRVTLDDGVLPAVTFDTIEPSVTNYDASALGTPLTFSVSALNRITGAGPATSESI